jgi:hypothetical protein
MDDSFSSGAGGQKEAGASRWPGKNSRTPPKPRLETVAGKNVVVRRDELAWSRGWKSLARKDW